MAYGSGLLNVVCGSSCRPVVYSDVMYADLKGPV